MGVFDDVRGISALDAARALGIRVQIRGSRGWALCPFHGERGHASLCLYPDSGWYCFGCHAGGDAVRLYEMYLGVTPLEAAQTLAQDFGIPIDCDDGALHVNVRHLESALERKRRARMLTLSEAYLAADEAIGRIIHQVGMEASMDDPRFHAALRAREDAQLALDELTEATTEQLLTWFAGEENAGCKQSTDGAEPEPGSAGAGGGGGDTPDAPGGAGGAAERA